MHAIAMRLGLALVLAIATSHTARADSTWIDSCAPALETFLHNRFDDQTAGMVVGLVDEHGRRIFAAGKLDNGTDQTVDANTVFELGSVTKVFTALLLLDSVRRGEVQPNDPVSKFLPPGVTAPTRGGKEITLLSLAVQDSGLPFFPDNLGNKPPNELTLNEIKAGSDAYTLDKLYASLPTATLAHDPGEKFTYSNVGMAILGHALERRTNHTYEQLVVDRICRPLRMNETQITLTPELTSRLATGHLLDGSQSEHWRMQAMIPSGALLSTANDMLTFLAANLKLTESALTPLLDQMHQIRHTGAPAFGRTAMPWVDENIYQPPGSEILGHAGGGYGTIAFAGFDRKKRRAVVVLTNQMKTHPNGVGWTLLQGMPITNENVPVREVIGVGVALALDEPTGLPRITAVFPDSPAGKAGITSGWLIRQVNDSPTKGKTLPECTALLAGPIDTQVRLTLEEPSSAKQNVIELKRAKFLTIRDKPPK